MNCPKSNKCIPNLQKFAKGDYICCGFNKKPTKYRHDVIQLCLKGQYLNDLSIEMTPAEALDIASVLTATLANIAQS